MLLSYPSEPPPRIAFVGGSLQTGWAPTAAEATTATRPPLGATTRWKAARRAMNRPADVAQTTMVPPRPRESSLSAGAGSSALGSGSGSSHVPVAIVGAGLSGMAAAFHLGRAGVRYRIFEGRDQPGGHVVTVEEQGYRFDRTGHLLHVEDAETRALALGWIGPEHHEVERRSAVWSHGAYTRYPFQANLYGLPTEVAYECLLGFVLAWKAKSEEPPAPAPADFEQFCLQHFGRPISERFMIPYNSRLWGVPPREITAEWCSRFVPLPTLEQVVAGALGLGREELGYNARFLYPKRGIGQLTDGLSAAVGPIELGRPVRAIRAAARELELDGETVSYDLLISTAPLPRLVELLGDAPVPVRQAATRLRATHLWYLDVALDRPSGRPYHWIYVPEPKYPFYRVGCYSHFSPDMAPAGKAGLYVELVDRQEPRLDDLLPHVVEGLCEMGIVPGPEAIAFARLRKLDPAYVVFDHGTAAALDVVRPFLEAERVLSVGRYGGWTYSSMAEALRFGRDAARAAAALLGAPAEGESP
jgi:protoporphyrinogen oxidase